YEELLETQTSLFDPRVSARILASRGRTASDYICLGFERRRLQLEFWGSCTGFDAVLAPTVACLPPYLKDLAEDDAYFRANARVLRNTQVLNLLGVPALSVPCGRMVGVSVAARPREEALVLSVADALAGEPGSVAA
ncbi:amidase family protein, partial [Klebsiella quasipneumoniae]|uniref:amidase family protein n=1 Tax=Klebsiella quasipneumoniae TaxID=1463165 RepID=UPI002004ABEC